MASRERTFLTALIWVAFTIISVVVTITIPMTGGDNDQMVIAIVAGVAATISTGVMWSSSRTPQEASEKAKRESRVGRWLETLDNSELDELRARLMDGQEEQSLEALIQRKTQQRRD